MKPPKPKSAKRPTSSHVRKAGKRRPNARTTYPDRGYLKAIESTLTEWTSPEDEAAWRDF